MTEYSAIVLAAGEGTRLRPLTRHRPKPMLPAATKPILEHVFDQLVDAGVSEIVVVVGYRRNRVQSHFGPTYRNVPLTYVTQRKQLGTGHALLAAEDAVDGTCLVVNGDQIVDRRIVKDVVEAHDAGGRDRAGADGGPGGTGGADDADGATDDPVATMGLLRRREIGDYGGVILDGDRVTEIVERPGDDRDYLLNVGVYVVEPAVFDAVRETEPRAGEHLLVDGLADLVAEGRLVRGVVSEGFWVDATYPWDLLDVSMELLESGRVDDERGPPVSRSAAVHESATIRDPVVVDHDCEIGPGAVVGPYACLGANVTVGANAVVERSVIDADTRIRASATVLEGITGVGVTVGPGSMIPGGPGDVRVDDRIFEGEALGALLADRVRDRGAVSYVPGSVVGPDAEIGTGATVRGTIAGGTEVRP